MPKPQMEFELRISGADVRPETVAAGDLAELLKCYETTVLKAADSLGIQITDEAQVAVTGIRPGSNLITVMIAQALQEPAEEVGLAVAHHACETLPPAVHESLHQISARAEKRGWSIELPMPGRRGRRSRAVISAEHPVPKPVKRLITGTTTLYGRLVRVGGMTPRATIQLSESHTIHACLTEELAKQLANGHLYETVGVEGVAEWNPDSFQVEEFRITRVTEFRRTSLVDAFKTLAEASAGRWQGVDPVGYVQSVRYAEDDG